ncbi:hypothetical protein CEXT_682071 [Caerostris extrusa]|uniref:Uncharacterized protein n=1 Tax=Caerostris extrusa TaxID=172846 RepID=A0AAV4UFE3_CAEEX|nr:hypothetical protein CEXT_682071 [Caerostris extrusa]
MVRRIIPGELGKSSSAPSNVLQISCALEKLHTLYLIFHIVHLYNTLIWSGVYSAYHFLEASMQKGWLKKDSFLKWTSKAHLWNEQTETEGHVELTLTELRPECCFLQMLAMWRQRRQRHLLVVSRK